MTIEHLKRYGSWTVAYRENQKEHVFRTTGSGGDTFQKAMENYILYVGMYGQMNVKMFFGVPINVEHNCQISEHFAKMFEKEGGEG